jgi:hypothetical protein
MDLQLRELSDGVQCLITPQFDDLHVCKGEHLDACKQEYLDIFDAFTCGERITLGIPYDKIHHHHTRS